MFGEELRIRSEVIEDAEGWERGIQGRGEEEECVGDEECVLRGWLRTRPGCVE